MLVIWSILVNILLVKFNWFLNSDCLHHRNLNISASWFWSNMDIRAGRSRELKRYNYVVRVFQDSPQKIHLKTRVRIRKWKHSLGGLSIVVCKCYTYWIGLLSTMIWSFSYYRIIVIARTKVTPYKHKKTP